MKTMNKIFTVGAMGFALTSMEAKADLFKCTACPAGSKCDGINRSPCEAGTFSTGGASSCSQCSAGYFSTGGASSCSQCGAGTYSNAGAGSCSSCGDNAIVNSTKTGCISITDPNAWSLVYNYSSGEGSATLSAGTYIVSLHGGNGGNKINGGTNAVINSGKSGGSVTYKFTVNSSWTFKYGVGGNGVDFIYTYGSGGGGGSWISINNQYIVAGGGGGISNGQYVLGMGDNCKGGSGGAVGSGSSSLCSGDSYDDDCRCTSKYGSGGNGGNYINEWKKNGECRHHTVAGGAEGEADDDYFCLDGTGINSYNIAKCHINGGVGGSAEGITLYPGYGRTKVGGDSCQEGSATHTSNINISGFACGTSAGCVKLYKLKN